MQNVSANLGVGIVNTFQGRTGAVTLTQTDVTGVGGAVVGATAPTNGMNTAAAAGASTQASRVDHTHPLVTAGRSLHAFAITAVGQQLSATQDVDVATSIVNNNAAGAFSAQVQISPDNITYTSLFQIQLPTTTVATLQVPFTVHLPAGWYIKIGNLTNGADGGHGAWW